MTSNACAASVVLGLAAWMAASGAAAQAPQPSVETQSVQYTSGTATIEAYVARPKGASTRPAVIVLHDDLGLNSRFKELAHQLADAGFVALAPHLPSRSKTQASEPRDGQPQRTAVAGLPSNQTSGDLRSAFAFPGEGSGGRCLENFRSRSRMGRVPRVAVGRVHPGAAPRRRLLWHDPPTTISYARSRHPSLATTRSWTT